MSESSNGEAGRLLPGAHGSATCCLCNWTNVSLLNLGEPGAPRWTCHGCCKRMLDTLDKLRDGDFAGTPINRGISAMMLIGETLSPNTKVSDGR